MPFYYVPFAIIQIFCDIYFFVSWRRFIKQQKWNQLLYKIPLIISIIFCLIAFTVIINKYIGFINNEVEITILLLLTLWYLPKLIITPFIIIKDIIKFLIRVFNLLLTKITSKEEKKLPDANNSIIDKNRRQFTKVFGWGVAVAPFIIITDGVARVTYDFTVMKTDIPITNLPLSHNNLKIIHISDIHAGCFYSNKPVRHAVNIINSLNPDIIVITGDFVTLEPNELDLIENDFIRLKTKYGIFACLGNHDHWMTTEKHYELINRIKNMGIHLLINENIKLNINENILQIAGTDNRGMKSDYSDFDKSLSGLDKSLPIILLTHDPKNWDDKIRRKLKADLTLCGHTHGGQIVLDVLGEQITPTRLFCKQWAGLYQDKYQYLYINRGFGTTGPPLRVGVPPEITLITLKS